jgi:hypothetical protein
MIKCKVLTHKKFLDFQTYTGYITIYDDKTKKYIYSNFHPSITRLTFEDAMMDAENMKKDLLLQNGIIE